MADISVLIDVIGTEDMVKATKTADRMRKEYSRLDREFNKGNISAQQYAKGVRQVDGKVEELVRSSRSYTKVAQAQTKAIDQATSALHRQAAASKMGSNQFATYNTSVYQANQRTKRFASVGLQQAGYQVGDFAVQLQGGTNAAVAFGQQGSQLLGIFGAWGAVAGAVLAIMTAFVAPMLDSAKAGGKMSEEFSKLGDQLKSIEPILTSIKDGITVLGEFAIDAANVILNNLDRIVVYGATVAAFFAGKWVAGFVAARVATLSLAGAITVVKTALLKFLPTAVLIAVGELVFLFVKLVKGAGGFGEALVLLKDVASGVWDKIKAGGEVLKAGLALSFDGILDSFEQTLGSMLVSWGKFVDNIAGTKMGEFMGLEGGQEFAMGNVAATLTEGGSDRFVKLSGQLAEAQERLKGPIEGLDKLREAMAKADEEGQRIDIRDWLGLGGGSGEDGDSAGGSGGSTAADDMTRELTKVEENIQSVADTMKNSMSDAFMSMVEGTKSFKDAMREMARAVIKQLFDILVVQKIVGSFDVAKGTGSGIVGTIMGMFANGAAFNNGKVTAFANGGVVNQPTVFPMANGMGLMGEAGPEAVMPLKRGKNGKLGVQMEGDGQQPVVINQSFNFSANGDESVKRIIAQEAPRIANLTQKQILDQRRRGGVMKSTFG